MTFADDQIVYRDLAGAWGAFRLIVGGKDVTKFRGVPAQIGGYQLQEPYGYGPADFAFPQLTSFEVDAWGTGALSWFDIGKTVQLVQVNAAGARGRLVWKGFISLTDVGDAGVAVHCDGEASGRLSLLDKHPELFVWVKDAGTLLAEAFRRGRLNPKPHLGTDTGIELDERRLSGGSLKDYCDGILAQCMTASGDQLTVMPNVDGTAYVQAWKDRATVAATVFNGASGVTLEVSRDLQEEPTTFYGSGRASDGTLWVNGKYPGLMQGTTPVFPGSLSLGSTGDDVQALQSKLVGMGYLEPEDALGATFDAETVDAVKDLQDDAGLAQTGVVNAATWDSLFDLGDTGLSLRQAHQAPLAQLSPVRPWNRTSNGSKASRNPNYDPERIEVDRSIDQFGGKKRARRWCKRELSRVQTGKNWVGTLTLASDVAVGDHTHGSTPTLLSRLDLKAGQNVKLRNFDGATLFHVAGVSVDSDLTVRLAVDTKARDLLTVGQIIERNAASRVNPARQWLRERRGSGANSQIVEATEHFGRIWTTIDCPADQPTVFPVIAGQSGSINQIRIKVTDSACEFVTAGTAMRVSAGWWRAKLNGSPWAPRVWQNSAIWTEVEKRGLLWAHGDESQPPGYAPGQKTGDDGTATGDPITGVFLDAGGTDYHTFDQPVIWVMVWPKQACKIKPQRILWPVLEAGM